MILYGMLRQTYNVQQAGYGEGALMGLALNALDYLLAQMQKLETTGYPK